MEKENIVVELMEDSPLQLLAKLCREQEKTTLILTQIKDTNSGISIVPSQTSGNNGSGNLFSTISDIGGTISVADIISGEKASSWLTGAFKGPMQQLSSLGSQALTAAETLAAIPAAVAAGIIALSATVGFGSMYIIGYMEKQGWIDPIKVEDFDAQINAIDSVMAASNPFIYEGDDTPKLSDYTPAERGELFRQKYEKRKKAQHNVAHMTSIMDQVGGVMPTSSTDIFPTHSAFANWQTNQPQPTATFDGWQQQQTQLADIQAQTAQFWQTYSESTQNQPITLNVTNNFKGVTQDRKSLNEISDYMARQIRDDLNAGRPLYSRN